MQPSEMESTTGIEVQPSKQDPPARRRARLRTFGTMAAVCLLVALFAIVMHRPGGDAFGPSQNGQAVPTDWQTYRDPMGLFSVRLPKEWVAQIETSTGTFGDRTGSATETTEAIWFRDPALGDASVRVYVLATPIHGDFERHWYCQSFPQKNSAFHGIAAQSMSNATVLFDTENAHFQLDVVIPGVLGPAHSSPLILTPVPTPTPLPQEIVAADRTLLATILSSLQPANTTALSC